MGNVDAGIDSNDGGRGSVYFVASSWTDPQVISSLIASGLALAIAVGNGFYNSYVRRKDEEIREKALTEALQREDEAQARLVTVVLASDEYSPEWFVLVSNHSNSAVLSLVVEVNSPGSQIAVREYHLIPEAPVRSIDRRKPRIEGSKIQALPSGQSAIFHTGPVGNFEGSEKATASITFSLPSGRRYRTDGGTVELVSQK